MRFRRFAPADLEACLELYRLNAPSRFPAGVLPWYFAYLAEEKVYTICLDGEQGPIATGGLAYHTGSLHSAMLCYGLVHPSHHGHGIGTALLLTRLALLDPGRSYYFISIATVADSLGYYRRFGFRPAGWWRDPSGTQHPMAFLLIFGYQIRRIRELLAQHKVVFPVEDMDLIPSVNPPKRSLRFDSRM